MKTIYIMRGVPGSGKSTVAEELRYAYDCANIPVAVVSADKFCYDEDGNYNWSPETVKVNHTQCKLDFVFHLSSEIDIIFVDNTNIKPKDFAYYEEKGKALGYRIVHLVVENRDGRNDVHNVPKETKDKMRKTLLNNIKL